MHLVSDGLLTLGQAEHLQINHELWREPYLIPVPAINTLGLKTNLASCEIFRIISEILLSWGTIEIISLPSSSLTSSSLIIHFIIYHVQFSVGLTLQKY